MRYTLTIDILIQTCYTTFARQSNMIKEDFSMKNANRFCTLLLSLFLLFSIPACGDAKNNEQSIPGSGAVDPSTPKESDDFDRHDTVFPGQNVPEVRFDSFENYKTFRDLVKKGGSGPDDAVAFARENLEIQIYGDDASDQLKSADQVKTLVEETENVKILLPQNKDWTLLYFSRDGSDPISTDENGEILSILPYKRCLSISYHNEALGYIAFDVYYDDATRNHTPRQFYRWGTDYGYDTDFEYTCKYVSPTPYITLPLASGETLSIFRLDDEYSDNKGFLFTDNSEITISYSFQNDETDQPTAPTKEEKETILRDFFEGAKVVTLAEAAG